MQILDLEEKKPLVKIQRQIDLSIVSPVYQAENLIDELVDRLIKSLSAISKEFQIVLVDDGSKDGSWEKILENAKRFPQVKGIQLSRNFGQHFAITAGIDHVEGDWVVVMDCDLQDRPEEIARLYQKALQGYDIVLARRVNRQDSKIKCFFSKKFYQVLSFLSGTRYDSAVANFGVYHKKVIASVLKMKEKIRYFPAMVNWVGFQKTAIEVEHSERPRGKSSYNFKKQMKLALDIILANSDKPLRLIIGLGLFFSLLSFAFGFFVLAMYFQGQISVLGYASIITSICFFSGVIISVLGVIGLYVGKIFDGIKNRPTYLIRDTINE